MSPFPLFRASDTRLPTLCLALILTLPGKSAIGDTPAPAPGALTLAHAVLLAQDRSRGLVALEASAQAARNQAHGAGQLPDPVLKLGISNVPIDGPARWSLTRDFMTTRSIGLMQELTGADKRQARSARFERLADAAKAGAELALAELRRDTALAWLDRYYQERMRLLLTEQRNTSELQLQAADAAYRGGRGAASEPIAARYAMAQVEDRIRQNELQIALATNELQRWIGPPGGQALAGAPTLDTAALGAEMVEPALANHPQIVVMQRQEDAALADVALAQANRRADWSVELMLGQRGPAYSNMVSLNLSVPLQWDRSNRQDRDEAASRERVTQIAAEREERMRTLSAQTGAWLQQWHNTRERLAHYDNSLIPLALDRTNAALASYRGGGAALDTVLVSREREIDTRIERLRLEKEAAMLWARLEFLFPPIKPQLTPPANRSAP